MDNGCIFAVCNNLSAAVKLTDSDVGGNVNKTLTNTAPKWWMFENQSLLKTPKYGMKLLTVKN